MLLEENHFSHLRRYLIEILAFSYDVDQAELHAALSTTCLATGPKYSGIILDDAERKHLLDLSTIIQQTYDHIQADNAELVPYQNEENIRQLAIYPADALNISSPFILDHLSSYHIHQCDPSKRKKTMLYAYHRPMLKWWPCHEQLAKQLISDDLLIWHISPSERVRLLLSAGVARFRAKHCPEIMELTRKFYADPIFMDVTRHCRPFYMKSPPKRNSLEQPPSYTAPGSPFRVQ